jgi:hypothetical protein
MKSPTFDFTPQIRSSNEWVDLAKFLRGVSANYGAARSLSSRAVANRRDHKAAEVISIIAAVLIELRRWPARSVSRLQ